MGEDGLIITRRTPWLRRRGHGHDEILHVRCICIAFLVFHDMYIPCFQSVILFDENAIEYKS